MDNLSYINSIDLNVVPDNMHCRCKKKNFTFETKRAVYEMLLQESHEGKLEKGVLSKVATLSPFPQDQFL